MNFEYALEAWNRYLKENPSATVLSDSLGSDLSREAADKISGQVYSWLTKKGIGKGDFVLINLDRGVGPVLAIMGVWKAGAAFTVVESSYAKDRIEFIRNDWQPKIEINEVVWDEILKTEFLQGYTEADDHDVCLGVYTSGTTGNPKGVLHEYGQLKMEMISEMREDGTWRENPKTRWGLVAPLNFVASLKIVVHFLYCGGHLYVMDYDTVKNPKKLNAYFFKNRINETFLSPSLLRIKGEDYGPFMKYMYTGSEPANNVSIKKAELNNTYTMSESFFTVCEYIIEKPEPVCPIGVPMFPLKIKLLDEDGNEVQQGETGEFCFENPYCRGYVNNDEENARHFIDGYYHTGDLAEFKNGMYTLKGRSDDMIKINGNRIEPSEIEAVCREEMGISSCAAKGFEEEGFVALYYTDNISFNEKELRKRLENRLPYYMIPTYYIHVDKYPLTNSAKLNRRALKAPVEILKEEYVAPRNDFEKNLSKAFTEILGVKDIGIKDDFFKLGGNSLKVMQLLSLLDEDELMTPTMVYQGRNIETISQLYKNARAVYLTPEEKEEDGKKNSYPISRNMKWYWDNVNDGSIDFYSCYQINGVVPGSYIVKGVNKYIRKNSVFNMVLNKGEDGIPVQVYVKQTPLIAVERMSEKQAQVEIGSFVRPFGYNEPLIRVRVLRTPLHNYLLFHAFHLITDGAGVHFIIGDMLRCIMGKDIEDVRYFCWALEENMRDKSPLIPNNLEYFLKNYSLKDYDFCIKSDENTGVSGHAVAHPAKVSLEDAQKHCADNGISIQCFLTAASVLAQSAYNCTNDNCMCWNYNNRGPKENHAGVMIRTAYCGIHRDAIHTVGDLYSTIIKQNEDQLWRLYEYECYSDVTAEATTPIMNITYLEDWFSKATLPGFLGKDIELVNTSPENPESEKVFLLVCTHEGNELCMSFNYGKSYLTEEHAEKFASMLQYSMDELMKNSLPDFDAFTEGGK